MAIHAKRKRDLVDKLHHLGLSISYDRVLNISTRLAQRVCDQFEQDRVVCPINMRTGLFTTAAVDNIDHNTSATTAVSSFHGMGISLFQNPSISNAGGVRAYSDTNITKNVSSWEAVPELPAEYALVPAATLNVKTPAIPNVQGDVTGKDDVSASLA